MVSQTESSSTPRPTLSRQRVLQAAIDLADQGGIQSVSMRKLAQALGVEAMSLYHYVTNKGEILDGMVEMVIGEIHVPTKGAEWKSAIRQIAISYHQALSRHPWACNLMFSTGPSPVRLRYMESVLATLREGGFSPELTHHAYHALESHILGFTLWAVSLPFESEDLPAMASNFLKSLSPNEYPYLVEHIQQHVGVTGEEDEGEFEFGLGLLLDGLEGLREEG